MLRQLKTTECLINSDEVSWNLAISGANLCRSSTKHFLKILWNLQWKTLARVSFLKHSATLKEDSGMVHVCVFKKITKIYYIFGKNARNKCFRSKYWQFSANIGQMFAFLTAGISLISLKISLKLRFTPISTKDMQKLW